MWSKPPGDGPQTCSCTTGGPSMTLPLSTFTTFMPRSVDIGLERSTSTWGEPFWLGGRLSGLAFLAAPSTFRPRVELAFFSYYRLSPLFPRTQNHCSVPYHAISCTYKQIYLCTHYHCHSCTTRTRCRSAGMQAEEHLCRILSKLPRK